LTVGVAAVEDDEEDDDEEDGVNVLVGGRVEFTCMIASL